MLHVSICAEQSFLDLIVEFCTLDATTTCLEGENTAPKIHVVLSIAKFLQNLKQHAKKGMNFHLNVRASITFCYFFIDRQHQALKT